MTVHEGRHPRVGLVFDDRYLQHNPGLYQPQGYGKNFPFTEPVLHPSNHLLVTRTRQLIDLSGLSEHLVPVEGRTATDAEILRFHTETYLEKVLALSQADGGETGTGAPMATGGEPLARLAAGGVLAAMDAVLDGTVTRAFALVRPPGHHAMPDRGMGYCIYGNVAIAVQSALEMHGLERVLILDWDVHHGNGTQHAFYGDPRVLFISLHQDNLYPADWGAMEDVGEGEGRGFTVNVPLPPGTGDRGYRTTMEEVVLPIAAQYRPQLVVVSAGQDPSVADPNGRMCVGTEGFRMLASAVQDLADDCCEGKLVVALEGGYAEWYAPYCTLAVIETLAGHRTEIRDPYPPGRLDAMPASRRLSLDAAETLRQVRQIQSEFWNLEPPG